MNSLYSNSTYEIGKYFSYSAAFLNIYESVECNSDPHSSHTMQIDKVKNAFIVITINQKSIQNGENLH